jgi:large subunit ribosomal protein L17
MFRNMSASFIVHEKIQTTHAKAMELRRIVERLVSKAAKAGESVGKPLDSLSAEQRAKQIHLRRVVGRFLPKYFDDGTGQDIDVVNKLFCILGPRFKERPGGYTRITKIGSRRGDNAPLALIEFLE